MNCSGSSDGVGSGPLFLPIKDCELLIAVDAGARPALCLLASWRMRGVPVNLPSASVGDVGIEVRLFFAQPAPVRSCMHGPFSRAQTFIFN